MQPENNYLDMKAYKSSNIDILHIEVMNLENRKKKKRWNDNLPANKAYIQKFYKKPEKEINKMENEADI